MSYPPKTRRLVLISLLALGAVAVFALFVLVLPPLIARTDHTVTTAQRLKAENDVRATLLQTLAGFLILTGLYVTYRTFQLNREGQITHRFTQAISQLGHESIDVRLGGIYALERIANDSEADRETISDVLAAFIREHARWLPSIPPSEQETPTAPSDNHSPQEDVQAALTVLGRRDRSPHYRPIDLSSVDLRNARFDGLHFERANFADAHLEYSNFSRTHLESANLSDAHLEHADFYDTHLEHAHLERAILNDAIVVDSHLESAFFTSAHLERVNIRPFSHPRWEGKTLFLHHLSGSHFEHAYLGYANLKRAALYGANFQDANLEGANLDGADLEDANLVGANLERATLRGAELGGANLDGAKLEGSDMEGASFEHKKVAPPEKT
jgi:uncharacterized protein YjbI with pentapeptide repeats